MRDDRETREVAAIYDEAWAVHAEQLSIIANAPGTNSIQQAALLNAAAACSRASRTPTPPPPEPPAENEELISEPERNNARLALNECEMDGRPLTSDEARILGWTLKHYEERLTTPQPTAEPPVLQGAVATIVERLQEAYDGEMKWRSEWPALENEHIGIRFSVDEAFELLNAIPISEPPVTEELERLRELEQVATYARWVLNDLMVGDINAIDKSDLTENEQKLLSALNVANGFAPPTPANQREKEQG